MRQEVTDIFNKYYPDNSLAFKYLWDHSVAVTEAALLIAKKHPDLKPDIDFIENASMLHDIGIFLTNARKMGCFGEFPYLAHGYLGRELLEKEDLKDYALVCERHVGVGISNNDVILNNLPLPVRDMLPVTLEEEIICYADKFFSKSSPEPTKPKDINKIRNKIAKRGKEHADRFDAFVNKFGWTYIYRDPE